MTLSSRTMLAKLSIEMLGMASRDDQTTRTVNVHLQTKPNAGYYQKCKVERADIINVIRAAEHARAIHKKLTRAFDDRWRILPSTRVFEYTSEMRAAKAQFEAAVSDVEAKWPMIIDRQYKRLGPLFVPEDYPFVFVDTSDPKGYGVHTNVDLSGEYIYTYKMKPTPDKGHLILDLEKEVLDELKEQLEADNKQALATSKMELWKRLFDPVSNMAEICSEDKKVFKTLITNIEDQLDILRDLNVTDDKDFDDMLKSVEAHLTGYTAGQVRSDKKLKVELGKKASVLKDEMSKHMGDNQTM